MDLRLARFFLRRLQRSLEADAVDHAVERGILVEHFLPADGRKVRTFAPGSLTIGKSPEEIAGLLRGSGGTGPSVRHAGDFRFDEEDEADKAGGNTGRQGFADAESLSTFAGEAPDRRDLLRAIRREANRPHAADVAALLLVARSITMSGTTLEEVLGVLRAPSPIITITGWVRGFEETFLDLLERGLILPGKVATCSGYRLSRRSESFRFATVPTPLWQAIVFLSEDTESESDTDRPVTLAAGGAYPILGIAESEERLPRRLAKAARINLICGPIDMDIVRKTMDAVLGEIPEGTLDWELCSALTLSDLALAIRPGISPDRALDTLEGLARIELASAENDEETGEGVGRHSGRKRSTTTTVTRSSRGNPGSGSERIKPETITVTGKDAHRSVPTVETLSGYGDAREWALGLKEDLVLWRAGSIEWEAMSTRLLLSGPPGTGKTLFARAVCNSLKIPLFVSSVATWLEPGYLGDVLKRMTSAFREAEAASPSILFIDEIDGLGRRSSGKDWSDYHNSVVNRALELLDGAAKISGVIVIGATNRPEAIDRAVLRSGRLEKHAVVPLPSTEALVGILEHHLGADLDAVIASAPENTVEPKDSAGARMSGSDGAVLGPVEADAAMTSPAELIPDRKDLDAPAGPSNAGSAKASSGPTEDSRNDTV